MLEGRIDGGEGLFIEPDQEFLGGRRTEDLVEELFKGRVRHEFQSQWGFSHLADAFSQCLHMLGTKVSVISEARFQFIDGFGGDAGVEDLVEPLERIMISLQSGDALFHSQAGTHHFLDRCQARQRWKTAKRLVILGSR